jgi:hypothetical protein
MYRDPSPPASHQIERTLSFTTTHLSPSESPRPLANFASESLPAILALAAELNLEVHQINMT